MKAIKITEIGIEKIFLDVFVGLTQTITKIKLETCEPFLWSDQNYIHILVQTTGIFSGTITCTMEEDLMNAICEKMAMGIGGLERDMLIQEYMNVVSGNGISMINTKMKKSSKLSVPCVVEKDTVLETESDRIKEKLWFFSDYGKMSVEISYKA